MVSDVKALIYDVFGTCVDWRNGVAREVAAVARAKGVDLDPLAFADTWRANYQPSMETVRSGKRPWTILDVLHRETLDGLLPRFGLAGKLSEDEVNDLNRAWHRLDPWPDTVPGLTRLKRKFIIAPHSNGNVALLLDMAKRAGIPWDCILGSEVVRNYKPVPASYLEAVRILGLKPPQVMMVAAHNRDLRAAQALGLRTGFVPRPTEHGSNQKTDLAPDGNWDVVARDFNHFADQVGA
ncbi:MAG TPA: haloacid dehalogenase type II [Alphaproteobacteria bacterium]